MIVNDYIGLLAPLREDRQRERKKEREGRRGESGSGTKTECCRHGGKERGIAGILALRAIKEIPGEEVTVVHAFGSPSPP